MIRCSPSRLLASVAIAALMPALFTLPAGAQVVAIDRQDVLSFYWGRYAQAVAAVGDVNGDGWGDVAMGVVDDRHPTLGWSTGGLYVYSGRDGSVLYRAHSPRPVAGGYFGLAVDAIQDLNGDGVREIIVGAYLQERSAYVYSGADGSLLYDLVPLEGVGPYWYGSSVAAVPDVDGDGVDDIAVCSSATVFVFSGATGLELHRFQRPPGMARGPMQVVAGVPDLDGDGRGDILAGASGDADGAGRVYLFSGRDGSFIRGIERPADAASGVWALSVAGLPDLDGDGMGDYSSACPGCLEQSPCGQGSYPPCVSSGKVYVYSGATGKLVTSLTGPLGPTHAFGVAVTATPDIDGGGAHDLLICSPFETPPGYPREAGSVYVFSGETFQPIRAFRSPNPYVPPTQGDQGGGLGTQIAFVVPSGTGGVGNVFASAPGDCPDDCPPSRRGRAYIFLSCAADFNYDGILDSRDFFDFILAFFDGRGAADFDRDGRVTSADFFAFIGAFFAGCEW